MDGHVSYYIKPPYGGYGSQRVNTPVYTFMECCGDASCLHIPIN